MQSIKKIIKALKKERIIYKLDGDDREYSVNLLNYIFNWHKIWENRYKLKDNVSEICFKDFYLSGNLDISNCSMIVVTMTGNKVGNFSIFGNDDVDILLSLSDNMGKEFAHVVVENSHYLNYNHDFLELEVQDASMVEMSGDTCKLKSVTISSQFFEVFSNNVDIERLNYKGDKISFNSSNGNIKNVSFVDVSELKINNCSFESSDAYFDVSSIPIIKDSVWMFSNPLTYNKGTVGKKDEGFVLDDKTFNKEECFDLGRAYVSYALSKVLEKVCDDNDDLADAYYRKVARQLDDLEREYNSNVEILEESRDVFEEGLQKVKLKRYVVDKKNN